MTALCSFCGKSALHDHATCTPEGEAAQEKALADAAQGVEVADPWAPYLEVAMRAAYPVAPGQVEQHLAEQEYRDVLAAVLPLYGAAVLEEVANDWQTGEWANVPRHANRVADRLGAAQHVSDWLRARAARLRAAEEARDDAQRALADVERFITEIDTDIVHDGSFAEILRAEYRALEVKLDAATDHAIAADREVERLRAVQAEDYAGIQKMANDYAAMQAEVTALRDIAAQLRKIWPGPSTDRAEVMHVVDVLTEQARDAASVPAQQPQGASGGSGSTGTLGERLRAEAEAGRVGQHARLSAIADEVDRLERERDHLRGRVIELIEGKGALPFEHDHKWVTTTTYDDSARGVTVQTCTVPGCPAVLETRP